MYKGSVSFSVGCGSGYRDAVRNLEVMVESLMGAGRRYTDTFFLFSDDFSMT